ncbi:MAG: hypothetical protein E7211_09825 [Clostridium lundense]|nr:hypothetical protein [Clostridium lundense]
MNENWCALCIAIIKNTTPEQAFEYYLNGKRGVNKTLTNEDVLDMIKFKNEGMTYKEIGQMYGSNWNTVRCRIKYYEEKQNRRNLCI